MSDEEGEHRHRTAAHRHRADDTLPLPHCRRRQCWAAAKLPPLLLLHAFYMLLLSLFPSPLTLPLLVDCWLLVVPPPSLSPPVSSSPPWRGAAAAEQRGVRPPANNVGGLFSIVQVSWLLGYFGKFDYFILPHDCSHVLCAHYLFSPAWYIDSYLYRDVKLVPSPKLRM